MASDYARRGRPRGSGLDDRDQLRRIAELLEADPTLRPTTAIKAIGVSDPSSIRRLRDKLKTSPEAPGGPASGRGEPASQNVVRLADARSRAASRAPAISSHSQQSTMGSAALAEPAPLSEAQMSWLAQWCAIGFSAMSSTLEAQMTVMNDLFGHPQVETALRQQLLFNEVAKAFCPKRSDVRSTTLH
jgi:hypothetical protein